MKLWIARDEDGTLSLYYNRPIREIGSYDRGVYSKGYFYGECTSMYLDKDDFPEITYENSPQQVEVNIIDK